MLSAESDMTKKFSLMISTKCMTPKSPDFLLILSLNCIVYIIDFIKFIHFIYSKIFIECFFYISLYKYHNR